MQHHTIVSYLHAIEQLNTERGVQEPFGWKNDGVTWFHALLQDVPSSLFSNSHQLAAMALVQSSLRFRTILIPGNYCSDSMKPELPSQKQPK